MAKTFFDTTRDVDRFSGAIKELYSMEVRFRSWFHRLTEEDKAKYKTMYNSFAENISVARADLGALFSDYLVNSAAVLAEKETEGQS